MRFIGFVSLAAMLLLQGCASYEETMVVVRIAFALFMFVAIMGGLFYAIYGNRKVQKAENDPRRPDAGDKK